MCSTKNGFGSIFFCKSYNLCDKILFMCHSIKHYFTVIKQKSVYLLILIICVGAILRLIGLDKQSLGLDEYISWKISNYSSVWQIIKQTALADNHPPLYYLLLHFIIKFFGDSQIILRILSVIAGALSIGVIFSVGAYIYSWREGLIAALLLALGWFPIYYSQEARVYSLLLLFTLITVRFWLPILKSFNEQKKPAFFLINSYIINAIILSYLHYFGFYFVVIQCLAVLILHINQRKIIFSIYGLVLLFYLPWLPSFLYQIQHNYFGIIWIIYSNQVNFIRFIQHIFNQSWALLISIIILCLTPFIGNKKLNISRRFSWQLVFSRVKENQYKLMLLLFWLIAPFVGVYIISRLWRPILAFKYLIISLPAAYILFARGLVNLPVTKISKAIIISILAGFLLYDLVITKDYYRLPRNIQLDQAISYIAIDQYKYKDSLLLIEGIWYGETYRYYVKTKSITLPIMYLGDDNVLADEGKINSIKQAKNIWYTCAYKSVNKELIEYLKKNFTLIKRRVFLGVEVWLFSVG